MIRIKKYNTLLTSIFALLMGLALVQCASTPASTTQETNSGDVEMWVTTGDRSLLLSKSFLNWSDKKSNPLITVDTSQQFQTMDGFGYSLTGGSAYLLKTKLNGEQRTDLLKELFLTGDSGMGISYLRISVGASDLDDHVFSYADKTSGKPDDTMDNFTLKEDQQYLIPVLKEILALNPNIKIMASPWSAPIWMKTNKHIKGGSLMLDYYDAYARYLVKYVQAMAAENINIDALTLQNEPENPKNTPSMIMTADDQANFVKNNLGPAFKEADIKTKIVIFDHNCDHPEYPIQVLNDAAANKYIDGTAFHLYLGDINAMDKVHQTHPDKNLYFTEQWTSGKGDFGGDLLWHTKNLVIGAPRNWSKNVLEWNLAADANFGPHTNDGGCDLCQGALTVDKEVTRNVSYYIIAHASKFVPDGSVRVASDIVDNIYNVAYLAPDGRHVLIALNEDGETKAFSVQVGTKNFTASLPPASVGTFVWK